MSCIFKYSFVLEKKCQCIEKCSIRIQMKRNHILFLKFISVLRRLIVTFNEGSCSLCTRFQPQVLGIISRQLPAQLRYHHPTGREASLLGQCYQQSDRLALCSNLPTNTDHSGLGAGS